MNRTANQQQSALWNGPSGQAWVEQQALLDGAFRRIETQLAETALASGARRVLDIGCGSGATTLAMARSLPGGSTVIGIDISEPLIGAARARARREGSAARFILADAQTHAFDSASFDLMTSRFGVMFFEDPVAAFANLRRAAAREAALCLFAFRSLAENPFMTTAERAAAPLLPQLPPRVAHAPGQFAFADRGHVQRLLEDAGWSRVELQAIDVSCEFPESELVRYFTRLGPVAQALRELDDSSRDETILRVRAAFQPYVDAGSVRFDAGCWRISARAAT
jgi:SAM-dependent methyltransferase